MNKKILLTGKGIEITLKPANYSNLYKPSSEYKIESLDYVYVRGIKSSKFLPILLKEWFFMIKSKGIIVIDYQLQEGITFEYIESLLWWLFKGNYDIVSHQKNGKLFRLIVRKKRLIFESHDKISRWTFGIITNGERNEWMEQIIKSIRDQKIPEYEIIVCGKYFDRKEKDFTYIDFNERAERGWITKKKNLIGEKAKYENMCIIHDRLVLDKNWYKGMKKYGNAFELLGCVQIEKSTNQHAGDWITMGGPTGTMYKISELDYADWDYYTYLSGQVTIIKKSIWEKVLWDELRYWYGGEDPDFSFRARDMGYIVRFNPFSKMYALAWTHGRIPRKYYIRDGLLPKDMLTRRFIRIMARVFYAIPLTKKIKPEYFMWFFKSKIYKFIAYH